MQTRELECLAQILNDRKHPAVAGDFLCFLVELLVGLEKGIDSPVACGGFEELSLIHILHLAKAVGGNMLLGFLAAGAFATILAVVSGLALAGASAISHDIYARVIMKGKATEAKEIRVSRIATICLGFVAIVLGILFEKQNIAFMVGLAFGVAAAANFPVLILSMYWKGLTTRGALFGGYGGLISAVGFVVLSKSCLLYTSRCV